ncbi:MAG TPA: molecular chaperone TorD family protein [Burkholderiales bacterium]|nr:molecular chaperone TorD family protein [Burkholderiales bacterium]
MSGAEPLNFVATLPPEEVARANFYGLLARLFYGPPDTQLLETLAGATGMDAEDGEIGPAWERLCRAAGQTDQEAVRDEYDTVFVGTGKAPVTLYTTAYSIRYATEAPLVELRRQLAALGLARRDAASEPEDHIAALCDAMRHLIAGQKRDLAAQSAFFKRWIAPTAGPLCDAIEADSTLSFYKTVARFAKAFFDLEQNAFELL